MTHSPHAFFDFATTIVGVGFIITLLSLIPTLFGLLLGQEIGDPPRMGYLGILVTLVGTVLMAFGLIYPF